MPSQSEIVEWFIYLGEGRSDLPYELSSVFFDDGRRSPDIEDSIKSGYLNTLRVLDFSAFLSRIEQPSEDSRIELGLALDDTSYYASLSLPFARQIVESAKALGLYRANSFVTSSIDKTFKLVPKNVEPTCLASKLKNVASVLGTLAQELDAISSAEQLALWSPKYLAAAAYLIYCSSSAFQPERA